MVGESRKWMILIATIWIQAFTGTNFDFSSYSSTLKSVLGISQLQLNYLSVASDLGKAFGWCSGVLLLYFPLWVLMFMATFTGLLGYGLQWLLIQKLIVLPYFLVFLLCLLSGCSICWFNTVCFVLCIRNFPTNRPLALSLSISYNGLSAALYTLIAKAINPEDDTIYLLLNALIPLITSSLALIPILRQPPSQQLSTDTAARDSSIFFILNILAVITGLYLLLLNTLSSDASTSRVLFVRALFLLFLPLCLPTIVYAKNWACRSIPTRFHFDSPSFNLVDIDNLQLHKELIGSEQSNALNIVGSYDSTEKEEYFGKVVEKDRLILLGEEHLARFLVRKWDFWLYYLAYFCSGTIGLVYSNNLGQIAESLGYYSQLSSLITLYSTCSFFGRLLSAAPDFLHGKVDFARTGWLAVATLATPIAFFLLTASGSEVILRTSTGLIGLSSGFMFSAAVSITSELFGPNSAGINHNILITNIPIGSLLYGLLAAQVYDDNAGSSIQESLMHEASVCMGRQCYLKTFIWWACISLLGLFSSSVLFLRTRPAYDRLERNRSFLSLYT
ncbi:protein NUCLEAR FUSION DEFECTIVE 4-like [Pistacia vera]|uniref:protein NUCLEAR FUSION DEFECTIVE 4-like n=1 Tax=Pistacia vera TaxID=55513 RepID=UPI0012630359|nr:protein NUCLEAR FUSION DEFECTIVE 4-like [Pistacia vera]